MSAQIIDLAAERRRRAARRAAIAWAALGLAIVFVFLAQNHKPPEALNGIEG